MKLARAKKNDELEKNRLLMEEYLKQQEDEYKQQIEKKITVKSNRKKKELESEYIQQKVTEKKATKPAVEKQIAPTPPVKQVSFFKVCS
jgi:Tfp pilus assembly protein PilE